MAVPLSRIWSCRSCFLRSTQHLFRRCTKEPLLESSVAPLSLTHSFLSNQGTDKIVENVFENPFLEKYKQKIQHMQDTSPEEFQERMHNMAERRKRKVWTSEADSIDHEQKPIEVAPPSDVAKDGAGMTKPKGLDSIIKMELIQDKTAEEIITLWNEYHKSKDMLFTTLQKSEYENLFEKSKECPVFVIPIPRADGFEFILSQFDRHDIYFTPLAMFQMVRENAPPCLTVNHFRELVDDKGIVLMSGQYDDKVLSKTLALSLVQQMSIFYGRNSKYYDLVRQFNFEPETFKYEELLDVLKTLPQHDMI